jgi:hypothetical protein
VAWASNLPPTDFVQANNNRRVGTDPPVFYVHASFGRTAISLAATCIISQKRFGFGDGFGKANPLYLHAGWKGGGKPGWQTAIKHHKNPPISLPPDQTAKGLTQSQSGLAFGPVITPLPGGARRK